jgi:signal transduction histidine kinase/Tfp pilus assembly protein PilF
VIHKIQLSSRKFFLLFFTGLLFPFVTFSQAAFTDSLNRVIDDKIPDSTKIDIINEVIFKNVSYFAESTIFFSDVAIGKSLLINDSVRLSRSLNRKAIAYYFMEDYSMALNYYFNALQISEKLQLPENIASDYNNMGLVLLKLDIFNEALNHFRRAAKMLKTSTRIDLQARVYDNIGIAHFSLGNYDSSLIWFRKSLLINKEIGQKSTLASNIKNVGNVLRVQKDFETSLLHYQMAITTYDSLGDKKEVAEILNSMAFCHLELGRFEAAKNNLERARNTIISSGSSKLLLDNILIYSKYYEKRGDKSRALEQLQSYLVKRDSMYMNDRFRNYEQLRVLAETNEKVKGMDLLKAMNRIQRETITNQRVIQYGTIALLILLVTILLLVVQMLRTKTRNNTILEQLVEERTKELKKAKEVAERSDEQKTAFLTNISHEVRTPMNAIVGFSELILKTSYSEQERNDILWNIKTSTLRLLTLFEKISHLAQLENSFSSDVKLKKTNLEEILQPLFSKYQTRISDCKLSVSLEYSIDAALKGKELLLARNNIEVIVDELLDNATKFTHKGSIDYGVRANDQRLFFFVKDTGEGIQPEQLDSVFDKFTKFLPSHCSLCDGAGIGLAIVKKNLELIDGQITIESQKGKGTIVSFDVPFQS